MATNKEHVADFIRSHAQKEALELEIQRKKDDLELVKDRIDGLVAKLSESVGPNKPEKYFVHNGMVVRVSMKDGITVSEAESA